MIDVHQCPFCELKFAARWELTSHLDTEHPGRITQKDPAVTVEDPAGDHDPL